MKPRTVGTEVIRPCIRSRRSDFAGPRNDQTVDEMVQRICEEAPCGGKNVCLTTDRALAAAGFEVRSSEPSRHHYDIILGNKLTKPDVERLVGVLKSGRRRNPAWKS